MPPPNPPRRPGPTIRPPIPGLADRMSKAGQQANMSGPTINFDPRDPAGSISRGLNAYIMWAIEVFTKTVKDQLPLFVIALILIAVMLIAAMQFLKE